MKHILQNNSGTDTEEDVQIDTEELLSLENHLVIYNDDVNTFQWVEQTLIEVCGHTQEQAMQCALIIHNNGKCSVKRGSYKKLQPMCEEILFRKISAVIE